MENIQPKLTEDIYYKGYSITPRPAKRQNKWYPIAFIARNVQDKTITNNYFLENPPLFDTFEEACAASIKLGKTAIDRGEIGF